LTEEFTRRRPYNAASEFIDANVARGLAGKAAFVDGERTLTYGELQARTSRFARALKTIGVRPEERIAVLLYDTVEFPVVFWGAIRAGVIVLPMNTLLTAEQYAYMLGDSRATALVVATPLASHVQPVLERLPRIRSIVLVGAGADAAEFGGRAVHRFEALLAAEDADPFVAPTISDEVAFWLYTSGSTGDPKAVRHVHSSLMATAKLMGQRTLGIDEGDVIYSAAKLYFAYGLGNAMSFPMSVGATTVLLSGRATPDAVLDLMRRHRPSIFYGVPTLFAALLAHGGIGRGMGSDRLRLCVSAGEALPGPLAERWRQQVGCEILDGIGSTEMLQTFLSNRPDDMKPGSTGRPVPGYDMKVVDEDGNELPDGQIGELVVRGPSAGDGYWNHRAKSRRTFVGEWTHTGDKFYRDAQGYFYYCGRTDDMFKVSGMWVSPFEVEAALISHEAVLEAAVIGKEDGDGLIKPKAFVVLRNGATPDDRLLETLRLHVKERAGPWKYPRWIDVRVELPKTATGKIQRFKLRDQESAPS
jgi:4-hydroxybenzoate-CoA ligase